MNLLLLKPRLYQAEGTPQAPTQPALLGGRCAACGYVFFPFQQYGCERCGAHGEQLQPQSLTGRGRLEAQATVHLHAKGDRPTPFVVGTVRLIDGPVVRTLLDPAATQLKTGDAVVTTLIDVDAPPPKGEGDPTRARDLRFTAA